MSKISFSLRNFMQYSILLISVYNMIFIPLQFGYRIPFRGKYLVLELVTILLYGMDIFFRLRHIKLLYMAGGNIPESTNQIEQSLMDDKDQFLKRIS